MSVSRSFQIPKRTLGKTGFEVASLGMGCASLGQVYGDMPYKECLRTIQLALRSGVNLFDTAPYYGITKSESVLGSLLNELSSEYRRDSYYLTTKIGRYGDDEFDFSAKRIESSIEESLNRLQTDYIDVVHTHDIEFAENIEQIWEETLPTLQSFKDKGIVRNIGVSGMPLSVLDYVCQQFGYDNIDTILTYNHCNIFNQQLHMFAHRFRHYNIGVIQGGATGLGLLTPQGPQSWHPAPDIFKTLCAEAVDFVDTNVERIANGMEMSASDIKYEMVRLAFMYTHSNEDISSVLIGPTTVEQLERNLQWFGRNDSQSPSVESSSLLSEEESLLIQQMQTDILAPIMNRIYINIGTERNIAKAETGFYGPSKLLTQQAFLQFLQLCNQRE